MLFEKRPWASVGWWTRPGAAVSLSFGLEAGFPTAGRVSINFGIQEIPRYLTLMRAFHRSACSNPFGKRPVDFRAVANEALRVAQSSMFDRVCMGPVGNGHKLQTTQATYFSKENKQQLLSWIG